MMKKRWMAAIAAAVLVTGGTVAFAAAPDEQRSPAPTSAVDRGAAGGFQDPVVEASDASSATATHVSIPRIGVESDLEQLPLDPETGELTPPVEWLSAGWYKDGTVPGEIGPAVIAGHVDSVTAPAVFARLGELVAGDTITVTLSDGQTRDFVVDSKEAAPKNAFPTQKVYGPTPDAQLRLITCDGDFDGATGHYLDNLIVNATLVA